MVTIPGRLVLEMLVTVVGVGLLTLTPSCRSAGVKGPPRVNGNGNEQRVVRAGETVKLPCPITASPDPLFEWKKDNEPVDDMWTRFVSRRHSLKIKGVLEADSGMYTCKGVNGFGQATATIQLIVLDKSVTDASPNPRAPVLTQVTEVTGNALEKEVGDSLVLRCQADALPKANVMWYKDDVAMGVQGVVYQQDYVKSLDTGVYTCVAKNVLGTANASFAIRVVEPSRTTAPMLAVLDPVNTTVDLGDTATLRCTVKADQRSMVQWLREISPSEEAANHNETVTYNKRRFRVLRSGATVDRGDGTFLSKFTIVQASPRDQGVYICLGISGDGYSLKEAHVTVVRVPPAVPPHDVTRPGQLNWLLLIIPAAAVAAIVVVVIVYQLRRGGASKPSKDENVVGVSRPPTLTSAKGLDETSVLAPLNPDSRAFLEPHKPDLVYQEPVYHQVSGCGSSLPSYHGYPHSERSVPEAVYPPNTGYPTPATSLRYTPASQYREQCRDRKGSDHFGGSHRIAGDHNHSRLPYGSTGGGACSGASTTSTAHTPFHAHTHPHAHPHQQYFVQYDL